MKVWLPANLVLGDGVLIGPGVRLYNQGRIAIGAGSVVTRDVPAGVLAAGNPCRVIRALQGGEARR